MDIFSVFTLFGGLALFLFGMDVMGKGLEKQAGNKLRTILEKLTASPVKGFLLGLTVTAIVQSSSATTVMVVGFVNSGIMSLNQAIGIIMGSNVGTTVTAWILSLAGIQGTSFWIKLLKPSTFSPILAVIGIILYMSTKNAKKRNFGSILLGFAILMTGMDTMSAAVKPLSDVPGFTSLFTTFQNPILGLLAGAALTAVLQSSSASVGILQALSVTGAITYRSAMPIIMGQNIGTCVTALISSVGANKNAKRAAIVHLYFNIIGSIVFLVGFYTLDYFFKFVFVNHTINAAGIAVIHTVFNLVATSIMLPFTKQLERLAVLTIKDAATKEEFQLLDERLLLTPALAVERSKSLMNRMITEAQTSFVASLTLLDKWQDTLAQEIINSENLVDNFEDKLGSYLVKLSNEDLVESDNQEISKMLHIIGDIERISDHSVNILKVSQEMSEKSIEFSSEASAELLVLRKAVTDIVTLTTAAFVKNDSIEALKAEPLDKVVGELSRQIKSLHIERLKNNSCTIELGFILSDLLTTCERVADHCSNVAVAIIEAKSNSFAPHEYISTIRNDDNLHFNEMLKEQRHIYKI